ncbi:MAG: InlB B-repeat-containing protein [Lentimicrobiaceae bacterium]|nr:InlB B-repeat-containing protein [Lentimicrobiaceae bacterium]
MKKIFLLVTTIVAFTCSAVFVHAQQLFSVNYNDLPVENVTQLTHQITGTEIATLSLTKNNGNKEVYAVAFSSAPNTKIVILNEQNGAHVTVETRLIASLPTEFQLTPFFIEELKQAVLGEASRYVILETTNDFLVQNVASVSITKEDVYIPRYFYGKKENMKEALPEDRQIIKIYKQKPRIISDPEYQLDIAQLEEEMSYYVYMYKLPDGTLCTYDEHFRKKNDKNPSKLGGGNFLEFNLDGTLNATQRLATEYALELWSEQIAGTVPVEIEVNLWPLGQGVIGMSFFPPCFMNGETGEPETFYPSALWNQLVGYNASDEWDIFIIMNSEFTFYYGLNGSPGVNIDYVTIMIHEATHGLGFGSQCDRNGVLFYEYPVVYDRLLYQGLGGPCFVDLTESERAALLTSNNLYAGGPGSKLLEANGGTRVKMYAPSSYSGGSTAHHWATEVTFPTFMKYAYFSPLHTFNNRKIGMFVDMGWTIPEVDPDAVWLTLNANGGTGNISPQPFSPGITQKIRINSSVRPGYAFKSWNTLPDGTGVSYADREAITISDNLNLYAQWEAQTYTLSFDPRGGTGNLTPKQVVYDKPIGTLPIPERTGYTFEGWVLYFAITITEETIWSFNYDRVASAKWTPEVGVVEIHDNASLQIVPNPADHTIELRFWVEGVLNSNQYRNDSELGVDCIEFYNIFGQLIKIVPFNGHRDAIHSVLTQTINISDLSPGVFIVKVGDKTVKLIKSK